MTPNYELPLYLSVACGVVVYWLVHWTRDSKGRGFNSRPFHFRLTTLGKLFTRTCLGHQSCTAAGPLAVVTVDLAVHLQSVANGGHGRVLCIKSSCQLRNVICTNFFGGVAG